MNICSRKWEVILIFLFCIIQVILVLTVASQDSRSTLEQLPGALCAQGNATKPLTSWFVTAPNRPSPSALRFSCWNAPREESILAGLRQVISSWAGPPGLQPFVSALGRLSRSRKHPQHRPAVSQAEQDPGQQEWLPSRWPQSQEGP